MKIVLGFIISTLAFSVAVYALNRHHGIIEAHQTPAQKGRVLVLATLFSLLAGWVVDKLDGDAAKPHLSMRQVIDSGDPVVIARYIIGIN
jgi:hypothetical protein